MSGEKHPSFNLSPFSKGRRLSSGPMSERCDDRDAVWVRLLEMVCRNQGSGQRSRATVYTNFSFVQTVVFADRKLWSTLNAEPELGNNAQVGIAYFVIRPQIST